MYRIASSNSPSTLSDKIVDCCMHVGDFADDILSIETRHRQVYFQSVVGGYVENKLSEKIATENVCKKWKQSFHLH